MFFITLMIRRYSLPSVFDFVQIYNMHFKFSFKSTTALMQNPAASRSDLLDCPAATGHNFSNRGLDNPKSPVKQNYAFGHHAEEKG